LIYNILNQCQLSKVIVNLLFMAKIISIMQDGLEKFVNKNRAAFDFNAPSFDLWENIEKELTNQNEEKIARMLAISSPKNSFRKQMIRYGSIAAVGLLLFTIGAVVGNQWTNRDASTADVQVSLSDVSDEYAEAEAYYTQKVNASILELKKYKYENDSGVLKDIEELDAAFQELKTELGQSNAFSKEEIVQAMIENYQMKIEILERVLERLPDENTGKSKKENSNEKANL
jgi:hypothetical protein